MNYGVIGSVSGNFREGSEKQSAVKRFLSENRRALMVKNQTQNQKYLDQMKQSINIQVSNNIGPYWRDHQSIKGWCSMNYPSVIQNPLLKKHEPSFTKEQKEQIKFSNLARPISGYQITDSSKRPFSTKIGGQALMNRRKQQQYNFIKLDPKNSHLTEEEIQELFQKRQQDKFCDVGIPNMHSVDILTSASEVQFGRSIHSNYKKIQQNNEKESIQTIYQIKNVDTQRAFSAFITKPPKKDKKKEAEEKKLKEEEEERQKAIPKVMSIVDALQQSASWMSSIHIKKKFSVGTVATAKQDERTKNFNHFYKAMEQKSNIQPMENYFGKSRDPNKDPFDRRVTQQLNDINFDEDSEDDFEDFHYLKRQPRTVLTEENLKKYLDERTFKLNLEHHYWLKDNFLDKLGRMAPNLKILSLRRLKISDQSFHEIFVHLNQIEILDISDCALIGEKGFSKFIESCGKTLKSLQASNCQDAIVNSTLKELLNIENCLLEFLDISFAKQITDEGLKCFENKTFPINHLCLNGLSSVSGQGLFHPINSCKQTLQIYEGALMDQEEIKVAEFSKALSYSFNLQILDLAGCKFIADDFFNNIISGETKNSDGFIVKPGLQQLVTVKLNFLELITDSSIMKICQTSQKLQNLEIPGCLLLTEYCIENIFKTFKSLQFIDINHIPAVTPPFFDILKELRPEIMIKRFQTTQVDPKDNMLRVPWRIVEKKKKGGKKKKKKK